MFSKSIQIGRYTVGPNHPPFIIAEMSGNHNQSLDRALSIVDAAAKTGVQALKLQTYTADTMTLNLSKDEFFIQDSSSLWKGKSLYDLYTEAATPWDWHEAIIKRCEKHGMICFSTPFDESAVDFLEKLKVPCYKIASFENNHLPLIKKVANTGKPVIVSTGMADPSIIQDVVDTMKAANNSNLILLKCTSAYPATAQDANLRTIPVLAESFGAQVGLSDHTMGIGVALAAVALGATVIEKHFTLLRADGGVDSAFSMEPYEMTLLVTESLLAQQAIGKVQLFPNEIESKSKVFRRSIYVAENIKAGEKFTEKNLRIIRPGLGLAPKYISQLIGQTAKQDYIIGTPLTLKDL